MSEGVGSAIKSIRVPAVGMILYRHSWFAAHPFSTCFCYVRGWLEIQYISLSFIHFQLYELELVLLFISNFKENWIYSGNNVSALGRLVSHGNSCWHPRVVRGTSSTSVVLCSAENVVALCNITPTQDQILWLKILEHWRRGWKFSFADVN